MFLRVRIVSAGAAGRTIRERGLTLIVPYPVGGGTDITARLLARDLEIALGKTVSVENRASGGSWGEPCAMR
jgi:tripartite-type tricarboxylate transporter receptor subunit TctC